MRWRIALVFEVDADTDDVAYTMGEALLQIIDAEPGHLGDPTFDGIATSRAALSRLGPVERR